MDLCQRGIYEHAQASMGYGGDLSLGVHIMRLEYPHLVTYMESHDERRYYQNKNFGNSSGSYYIQMSNITLARMVVFSIFTSNTRTK